MISVLITSYNRASTLRRAVDSVLEAVKATEQPVQVVVVDDGSTDGSVDILREYYERRDISVLRCMEHYGMMRAFSVGLSWCRGEYVAFCDCDDYWIAPSRLKQQYEYMQSHPDCGLCVTLAYTFHHGKLWPMKAPSEVTFDRLLRGNADLHAQTYFMRMEAFGRWVDREQWEEFSTWDYPIVLELVRRGPIHCLPFYSAVFVKGDESVTQTGSRRRRLKYVMGNHRIRLHFIVKYGCRWSTAAFLLYRVARDLYSVIFRRWKG